MGHDDLGQHYHRIGDLVKSNKIYSQMREFCTTNIHIVIMYMHIINVCIDQKAWFQAQNHIQRLRGQLGGPKNEDAEKYSAKLSAAYGLASMAQGNYAEAAREFIKTNPRMSQAKLDDLNDEEAYNEVLTPNDIAVYGGLCALASMDRDELQKNVLDSSDFRNYLELESHIRQAISHFIMGRYSECLKLLDEWKPDYLLDIYLLPHIPHIYYEIRCRAIRQYFIPYSCVTLAAIAKEFNIDEPTIEFELTQMIKRVDLNARLDRVENKLVNSSNDPRLLVHASALACAKEYERTAHTRMIKMAVNNASLEVKSPKDKGNQVSGGGGGGSQEGFGFNGVIGDMLGNQGRGMRSGRGLG